MKPTDKAFGIYRMHRKSKRFTWSLVDMTSSLDEANKLVATLRAAQPKYDFEVQGASMGHLLPNKHTI